MLTIITTAIGIITFFISYRWTVTASKERKKNAYKEIVSVCVRALVQGKFNPTCSVLEDVIKSKAREHEVELEKLPSVSVLLEDVTSKILENEFIPNDTKQNLLDYIAEIRKGMVEKKETLVEEESETNVIVENALFAFMTLSVLTLVIVIAGISSGLTITTSSVIMSLLGAILALIATTLGLSSKEQKRKKKSKTTGKATKTESV